MSTKKNLFEEDLEIVEIEYDQIYLKLVQLLYGTNMFQKLDELQNIYGFTKNRMQKRKEKRLEASGKRGSIMFVGTNPSVRSKLKNVWDDPYGQYFGSFLKEAGIEPNDIWATNLYKYQTPDNRELNEKEIKNGFTELQWEIGFVSPTLIVPLGAQSRSVFSAENYKFKKWKMYDVFGLPHPSFIKRNPADKDQYIQALKTIKKYHDKKINKVRMDKELAGTGND